MVAPLPKDGADAPASVPLEERTPPFRSLQLRLFLTIAGSLTLALLAFSATYHHFLRRQIRLETAKHAGVVADTIALSVMDAMHQTDRGRIESSLNAVVDNPALLEVVIADPAGAVRFASRRDLVGKNIGGLAYGALERGLPWVAGSVPGQGPALYRLVPIRAREECRSCHGGGGAVLGTIGIAVPLSPEDGLLRLSRKSLLALAVLTLGLLFALSYVFLARKVLSPLGGLIERFRAVGEGRREVPPPAPGTVRDEIGVLHGHFERMLAELKTIHQVEVERERELVALQRDHRFQTELEEVNRELTGRIGELDVANRRIQQLALQLDEKNRSLERAVKNISALNRVGVALSSELDIDRLVQLLINVSVKGLRVEIGYIMLIEGRDGRLAMRAWTGLGNGFDPAQHDAAGAVVSAMVAASGKPLLIRHVDGSQGVGTESRFGFQRRSVLCTPIRMKDRLLGTIELTNKKGEESFTEEDLEMLQSIANQAAVAIENANLYREVERSYLDTIRALVQAVEEKDKYTRGHSERVTAFSVKIAYRMGLSPRQVQIIQYAGVLHDIGKIGIDLAILQKKDRLSAEEFDVVKKHPLIGERIIRPIGFLSEVLPGVSQHHERYDGFGYPLGLSGAQTTLEARILSVADAYDAMITERPYRKPLGRQVAIAELQRCSGTQFDPLVVEHFIDLLESDPEIRSLEDQLSSVGT